MKFFSYLLHDSMSIITRLERCLPKFFIMKKAFKDNLLLLLFLLTPLLFSSTKMLAQDVNEVTIGNISGPTTYAPVNLAYNNSCSETIYTSSVLNEIQAGNKIVSLTYMGICAADINDVEFELYFKNTNSADVSKGEPDLASMTKVFCGPATVKKSAAMDNYSDIVTFNLQEDFVYEGNNLLVTILAHTATTGTAYFAYEAVTQSMSYRFNNDGDPTKNLYPGNYRPVIKLGVQESGGVQQQLSSVGEATDCAYYGPLTLGDKHSASETIYKSELLNIASGSELQSITYKGWVMSEDNGEPFNIKVWLANTDENEYNTEDIKPTDLSTMTKVFDGEVTFPKVGSYGNYDNILDIKFDTPFKYDGKNLKVYIQSDNEASKYVYFAYDSGKTNTTIYASGDEELTNWYMFSGMPVIDIKYTEGSSTPIERVPDIIVTTNKEKGESFLFFAHTDTGISVDYGDGKMHDYPFPGNVAIDNDVVDSIIKIYRYDKEGTIMSFSARSQKVRNIKFNTKDLIYLELPDNDFTSIDLSNCPKLEGLNLSGNKFEEIEIKNETLKDLNLSKNDLQIIHLGSLVNLESLNVSVNILRSQYWMEWPKAPNLKNLNVGYNLIYELDLKEYPNLETLICNNNNIEYLDLQYTPNLKELTAFYNGIKDIDLSPCSELQTINMMGTQITDIDISENAYLENVILSNNKLKEVNVENNICLKNLEVNNNNLTELDLSNNSDLNRLNYAKNNIKEIDFSNNRKLNYLDCSENGIENINTEQLTKVDTLICKYNKLKSIELPYMEYLTTLDCSSNYLTELVVKDNLYLANVNCFDNQIKSIDFTDLTDIISLNINSNLIDKDNMEKIFLDIPDINGIEIFDFEKLWKGVINFANNPGSMDADKDILTTKGWRFNISEDVLGDASAAIVVSPEVLNTHYTISMMTSDEEIYVDWGDGKPIAYTGEGESVYTNISGIVSGNIIKIYAPETFELGIARCDVQHIYTDGMKNLIRLACSNNNITDIDLSNNEKLEELGCGNNPLATLILPKNSSLKTLNCDKTLLRDINFNGLSNLEQLSVNENRLNKIDLSDCSKLTYLSAYKNEISDINLSGCEKLEEVYLGYNKIKELDFSNNYYLTFVSCGFNELENINVKGLENLKYLMCAHNKLSKLEVNSPLLVELLAGNNNLTEVDLSDCYNITTFEITSNKLTKMDLSQNEKIKQMFIGDNNISEIKLPSTPLEQLSIFNAEQNNLSELDFGALKNVKELVLSNNKFKGELDLSETSRLDMLIINNNEVEKIIFPENCVLTTLYARYNKLKTLNVPGSNLFSVDCTKNKIAAVNFGKHTNLFAVFLDFNDLQSINFKNNKQLAGVSLRMNKLGKNSLNQIYEQLPDINGMQVNPDCVDWMTYLFISGNPGADESDMSIATGKGWKVIYNEELPVTRNLTVNVKDENNNPINDAKLVLNVNGNETELVPSPLGNGSYVYNELEVFANVEYSLTISKEGFETKYIDVEGLMDGDIVMNVILTKDNTAIEEISNVDFKVIGGKGLINIISDKPMMIRIYNMSGSMICEREITDGHSVINGLAKGLYIVNGNKVIVR